jgi:hypothetical protein
MVSYLKFAGRRFGSTSEISRRIANPLKRQSESGNGAGRRDKGPAARFHDGCVLREGWQTACEETASINRESAEHAAAGCYAGWPVTPLTHKL